VREQVKVTFGSNETLKLKPLESEVFNAENNMVYWENGNSSYSRKKLEPYFKNHFEKLKYHLGN
jgi:hypothetical protein